MSFLAKVWSYKKKQSLPDSSFAYVDAEGGHFPYKDKNGKIDEAHVNAGFSYLSKAKLPAAAKKHIHQTLVNACKEIGKEHKPCSFPGCKGYSPTKKSMLEDSESFYAFQRESFRNLRVSMGVSWM
jgi:hypothetical protein